MGGSGSGQWYRFSTKTVVEECSVLSISTFKDALKSGVGYRGSVRWTIGDREAGSVGYRVDRVSGQLAIRLLYTITRRSGGQGAGRY